MKKILVIIAFAAFSSLTVGAQVIGTYAGNSDYDYGDGSEALMTKLHQPWALATDDAGNVYFSEPGQCVIRKIDTHGIITRVAGNGTPGYSGDHGDATAAQLNTPYGIAVDHDGNLFIADSKNDVVRKVDAAGKISTSLTGLQNPFDLAVDKDNNLYISDAFDYAILKQTPAGVVTTVISGFSGTLSGGPCGYTGDLWFPSNARLSGIAVDDNGNVYIADYWDDIVRKVTPAGVMTKIAGRVGMEGKTTNCAANAALLAGPRRIAIDHSGNIVFTDQGNCRICKIDADGGLTTIAGANCGFSGDGGAAISAAISGALGLAYDRSGFLYIADNGNNRVRKISPWGVGVPPVENVEKSLEVYPNPGSGVFTIKNAVTGMNTETVAVTVTDMTGRIVFAQKITTGGGKTDLDIRLNTATANGLYMLSVVTRGITRTAKITINK